MPPTRSRSVSDRRTARARGAALKAGYVVKAHRRPRLARAPLVSVVVATYNWSSVLRYAVASALGQAYPELEVIVVGDACTDDSEQVVRAFRDPRVRWDNLAENSGSQSLPNNRGIELARGDYIAYLGHDDLWHPNHLAYLVSAAEHSDASLALAASLTIGPPGSNARTLMNWVFPSAALHRRDAVDRVGPWRDFRTIVEAPDEEFLGRMAAAGGRVWSNALTLWKLPSAMRSSSYVERRSDEQAKLARRMRSERFFVERELAAWLWLRVRSPELHLPERDPLPEPVPPGWYVRQLRKIRGLPEEPVPRGEGRDG